MYSRRSNCSNLRFNEETLPFVRLTFATEFDREKPPTDGTSVVPEQLELDLDLEVILLCPLTTRARVFLRGRANTFVDNEIGSVPDGAAGLGGLA